MLGKLGFMNVREVKLSKTCTQTLLKKRVQRCNRKQTTLYFQECGVSTPCTLNYPELCTNLILALVRRIRCNLCEEI